MIEVFLPHNKQSGKTISRGFWYSPENKRTYYDYIYKHPIGNWENLNEELSWFKNRYKQEAIFYIQDKVGHIYYSEDNIGTFKHRIYKRIDKQNLKKEIKRALKLYNGVTINIRADGYYEEIFY
jgi:hypothetical protein